MKIISRITGRPVETEDKDVTLTTSLQKDRGKRALEMLRAAGADIRTSPKPTAALAPAVAAELAAEVKRGFEKTQAMLAAKPAVPPDAAPAAGPARPRVAAGAVTLSAREIELCARRGWNPDEYLAVRAWNRRVHNMEA